MIEHEREHDCPDCTHIIDIPVREGPKTKQQQETADLFSSMYEEAIRFNMRPMILGKWDKI